MRSIAATVSGEAAASRKGRTRTERPEATIAALSVQAPHHRVVRDAGDPEHVRRDPEADAVLLGHRGHVAEGLHHDVLEPLVDLGLAPEESRAVLHPLEV